MTNLKHLDIKQNKVLESMSDDDLIEGIKRLNKLLSYNKWDVIISKGIEKACIELEKELKKRQKKAKVSYK